MDKQEFIQETISSLMYEDEFLEYSEAYYIASKLWESLQSEEDEL